MKSLVLLSATFAALTCSQAFGQCQGGGGGGGATASGGAAATFSRSLGGASYGSVGQLLTGPGSAYHDDMLQMQAMRAYQQRQYEIAAAKAAKTQARRDAIKASVIAYKQREDAKKGKFSPSLAKSKTQSQDSFASLAR